METQSSKDKFGKFLANHIQKMVGMQNTVIILQENNHISKDVAKLYRRHHVYVRDKKKAA